MDQITEIPEKSILNLETDFILGPVVLHWK